jgi:hypothetical protein
MEVPPMDYIQQSGNRLTALFVTIGTCRGKASEVKELAQSLGLQEAVLMKDLGIHRTSKKAVRLQCIE